MGQQVLDPSRLEVSVEEGDIRSFTPNKALSCSMVSSNLCQLFEPNVGIGFGRGGLCQSHLLPVLFLTQFCPPSAQECLLYALPLPSPRPCAAQHLPWLCRLPGLCSGIDRTAHTSPGNTAYWLSDANLLYSTFTYAVSMTAPMTFTAGVATTAPAIGQTWVGLPDYDSTMEQKFH